jgi:hypothetical protein
MNTTEWKHTPAHWKPRWSGQYGDICKIIPSDGHGAIATIHLRRSKMNNLTEWSANARLIAAAPELLELAKAIQDILRHARLRGDKIATVATDGHLYNLLEQTIIHATGNNSQEV